MGKAQGTRQATTGGHGGYHHPGNQMENQTRAAKTVETGMHPMSVLLQASLCLAGPFQHFSLGTVFPKAHLITRSSYSAPKIDSLAPSPELVSLQVWGRAQGSVCFIHCAHDSASFGQLGA